MTLWSAVKISVNSAEAVASKSWSRRGPRATTVTSVPKLERIWANSIATTPEPTIASRFGRSGRRMIEFEVTIGYPGVSTRAGSSPGVSGIVGAAPAAMTMRSAVISSPESVTTVFSSTKRTCSGMTVLFGWRSLIRYSRPPASIASTREKMRSCRSDQSTPENEASTS